MIEDKKILVSEFHDAINQAKANELTFIEVEEELIKYFNPQGLGGVNHFIYQGIRVFPKGHATKTMAEESVPLEKKIHPNGY